jgi:hypothetical protein
MLPESIVIEELLHRCEQGCDLLWAQITRQQTLFCLPQQIFAAYGILQCFYPSPVHR